MAYKDKAQAVEYNNSFISRSYDRINLTVQKGEKDAIRSYAASRGESVNAFINRAIQNQMLSDRASVHDDTIPKIKGGK